MEFGQKKILELIYLISRVFFAWTFLNILAHCATQEKCHRMFEIKQTKNLQSLIKSVVKLSFFETDISTYVAEFTISQYCILTLFVFLLFFSVNWPIYVITSS